MELLKYGLKHPIHPLQVNKTDILTTFDFMRHAMTKDLRDEKQSSEVQTKISNLAHSYVNNYKPTLHALKKHRILKRSVSNKDIVVLRPDEGSGTVVLNRNDYVSKLFDIISDTSKFKKLPADPTLLREGQLQRFLRKLKNEQFFKEEVYDKIYPSGSKLAFIYGLPKIHKVNCQRNNLSLRLIVSSIGSYNYHLSKFLTDCLILSFLHLIPQKIRLHFLKK